MKINLLPVLSSSFTVCFLSLILKILKHLKEILTLCLGFFNITSKSIFLLYFAEVLSLPPKRNPKKIQLDVFTRLENFMSKITLSSRFYTQLYTDIYIGKKSHLHITLNAFVSLCDLPDAKKQVSFRTISCLLDRLYFYLNEHSLQSSNSFHILIILL